MVTTIRTYRDDGPLIDLAGGIAGQLTLNSPATALVGVLMLVGGLGLDGPRTGLLTLLGVGGFVLAGLASGRTESHDRFEWVVPPLLRAGEYLLVIWLAWRAGVQTLPIAYGLLAVLAFHHYDIVYRLRHQQIPPPDWVRRLGGGWEVRVLVLALGATLGAGFSMMVAVTVWCGLLFVGESVVSWVSVARDERRTFAPTIDDDEGVD